MSDPAITIRVEIGLDPDAQSFLRALIAGLSRGYGPPDPATPAKEDTLSRIEQELEAEITAEGAPKAQAQASTQKPEPAPEPVKALPPLPEIKHRLGMLSDADRAAILAHREAGMAPGLIAHQLGVRVDTISGLLYAARKAKRSDAQPSSQKHKGFWSAEKRAELLRRREANEDRHALAKAYGVTPDSIRMQLYLARQERDAPSPEVSPPETAPPEASPPASLPPAPLPPASLSPAPLPRPPAAPLRQIRQDLEAEMRAFEAKRGVTRVPSGAEFMAVGVPMTFNDEAHAIEWLTQHGHTVRKGPGMGAMTINGEKMPRVAFTQRAAAIAREHGMRLIAQRQTQGRAA
jgi:hypothetical protein